MKCVFIGTGNVATLLAKMAAQSGHKIMQIAGRNETAASLLAKKHNTLYTTNLRKTNPEADLYIVSVSDSATKEVVEQLQLPKDKTIVHTAGSLSVSILKNITDNYGILYPLQSIRKEMQHIPDVSFFIDGNSEETKQRLAAFAQTLSSLVFRATDEERLKLHLAAVLVSNFSNYLFTIAEDFCQKENIDFRSLLPLMQETVSRLQNHSPSETMTGPAFRHDENTLNKHLGILQNHTETKEVYKFLSRKIKEKFPRN